MDPNDGLTGSRNRTIGDLRVRREGERRTLCEGCPGKSICSQWKESAELVADDGDRVEAVGGVLIITGGRNLEEWLGDGGASGDAVDRDTQY